MLREKQNEQRRKQNEIREKYKEEAAKREQLKKGDYNCESLVYISGCHRN